MKALFAGNNKPSGPGMCICGQARQAAYGNASADHPFGRSRM